MVRTASAFFVACLAAVAASASIDVPADLVEHAKGASRVAVATVTEIAEWTIEALGIDRSSIDVRYTGGSRGWKGDVAQVKLDTTRMTALGWQPKLSSREAVRRTLREAVEQSRSGLLP